MSEYLVPVRYSDIHNHNTDVVNNIGILILYRPC